MFIINKFQDQKQLEDSSSTEMSSNHKLKLVKCPMNNDNGVSINYIKRLVQIDCNASSIQNILIPDDHKCEGVIPLQCSVFPTKLI